MGLDMYLEKRTYVKRWKHQKADERTYVRVQVGGKAHPTIQPKRVSYIIEEVGYWRKANAIHNWFIENCADGVDNGRDVYVDKSQLEVLLELVTEVLDKVVLKKGMIENGQRLTGGEWEPILEEGLYIDNIDVARELLPTTSGFFFGSTNYDQWYHMDLELTKEILEDALSDDDYGSFYYSASW